MANLPAAPSKELTDWCLEAIPDYWLGKGGREFTPHVTLLYGFRQDTPEQLEALRAELLAAGPLTIQLLDLSVFPEGNDGVPLKLAVDSQQLHDLNRRLRDGFDVEVKFPDYVPHVTVAYLDPQFVEQALRLVCPLSGCILTLAEAIWSPAEEPKLTIPLVGSVLPFLGAKAAPAAAPKQAKQPVKTEVAKPKGNVDATSENNGQKVSGTRKDSLGREFCWQEGVRVPCNHPDELDANDANNPKAEESQRTRLESAELLTDKQENQQQPEPEQDTSDPQFQAEWDKEVSQHLDEVQTNNVADHPYSVEEVAAEQNWHSEFIKWRWGLTMPGQEGQSNQGKFAITPADIGPAARFMSGLLNPALGGARYVAGLLDGLGTSGKRSKSDAALGDELEQFFNGVSPDNPANKLAAELSAKVLGPQAVPIAKNLTPEQQEIVRRSEGVANILREKIAAAEAVGDHKLAATLRASINFNDRQMRVRLAGGPLKPEKGPERSSEESESKPAEEQTKPVSAPATPGKPNSGRLVVQNQKEPTTAELQKLGAPTDVLLRAKTDPEYAYEWVDRNRRVATAKKRAQAKQRRLDKMTPEQRKELADKAKAKLAKRRIAQEKRSAAYWKQREREAAKAKATADKLKEVSTKALPPAERFQLDGLVREFRAMMERFRHFGIQVPTLSDRQIAESIRAALGFVQQAGDGRAKVLPVWESKSALDTAARFLADKWNALVARYGRAGAAAMLTAMLATFPIPGNIAAVIAAAEAARYFTSSPPQAAELGKGLIPGGLSEGVPDDAFDPEQLAAGIAVELEHTSDPDVAREIAKDHLCENPDYYVKLRRMEGKAMSALNSTTGGALVKPPKFMGKVKLKRTDWSRFKRPG